MPSRPVSVVIANRPFLAVSEDCSALEAARQMSETGQDALLVTHGRHLVGICTESDFVRKIVSVGRDPATTPIADIMVASPSTCRPYKALAHALHMMYEGGFRHVPVVDSDGSPLGIVSSRDVLGLEVVELKRELEHRQELAEIL